MTESLVMMQRFVQEKKHHFVLVDHLAKISSGLFVYHRKTFVWTEHLDGLLFTDFADTEYTMKMQASIF